MTNTPPWFDATRTGAEVVGLTWYLMWLEVLSPGIYPMINPFFGFWTMFDAWTPDGFTVRQA